MTDEAGRVASPLTEGLGPRRRSATGDVMVCADARCGWMGRCVVAEPLAPGEERDCQHGQLARACDRCADAREIAELKEAVRTARADDAHCWGRRVLALTEALTEIRDRIKAHPAYADLTEEEEIETGGDTAELSYLARVADAAIGA